MIRTDSGFAERAAKTQEEADERQTRLAGRRLRGGFAAIDFAGFRRQLLAPRELMADNLRLLAHDAQHAAVALRKPPAEIIHRRFGIGADEPRVFADPRARENAGRPAIEMIALQAVPERGAHFGRLRDLGERDPALDPEAAEVGAEGVLRAHTRKDDSARTSPAWLRQREDATRTTPETCTQAARESAREAMSRFGQPITFLRWRTRSVSE